MDIIHISKLFRLCVQIWRHLWYDEL